MSDAVERLPVGGWERALGAAVRASARWVNAYCYFVMRLVVCSVRGHVPALHHDGICRTFYRCERCQRAYGLTAWET